MFETAAPIYREALAKSGYNFELKFDPNAGEPRKNSRNRKRKILWFNPPYNSSVKSNIGKDFLKLIDKSFPPGHPLRKIVNKNTVKVSYSCTPNMKRIIASRNSKHLAALPSAERTCNCPRNTPLPSRW